MPTPAEIADRLEISDVLHAYAAAIDARDWESLTALFAPDAVLDYTASRGPRAVVGEAIEWLRSALSGFSVTQHLLANVRVTVEDDEATAVASYFNPMGRRTSEGLDLFFVGGSYRSRLRRTPGGWLIAEHLQGIDWMHRP